VNWAAVAAQKALLSPTPEWDVVLGRAGLLALFSVAAILLGTGAFRSYQRSI